MPGSYDVAEPPITVINLDGTAGTEATVSELVEGWRRTLGLSLESAGRLIGVAHTTVRDWERGRRPQDLRLVRLSHVVPTVSRPTPAIGAAPTPAPDDPDATPALLLREARLRLELTVREVARGLGVSTATVSKWERGLSRPHLRHLPRLASVLRLDAGARNQLLLIARTETPRRRPASAQALGRARVRAGLSQRRAAARLGISDRLLRRYESGQPVPLSLVIRMAREYGIGLGELARATGLILDPLLHSANWSPGELPRVLPSLREACGLSRAALARRAQVSARLIAKWESGEAYPHPEQERRIAVALGLAEHGLTALRPPAPRPPARPPARGVSERAVVGSGQVR